MNINKKLKFLVATSALVAMNVGSSAWGVNPVTAGAGTLKLLEQNTVAGTVSTDAIAVDLDISGLSDKALTAVAGNGATQFAVAYANDAATPPVMSSGEVTLTLKGALAKDATLDGAALGGVKIKSLVMNTTGAGYTMFKLDDFRAHLTPGALMNTVATGTSIINTAAGDQNIGFQVFGGAATVKNGWVNYGTDAAKLTNLKITGSVDAGFEANYDFTYVKDLAVDLGAGPNTLTLNNKAATAPNSITFLSATDVTNVASFADKTVLPLVQYVPSNATAKGGAAGKITTGNVDMQINQLGADKFAIAEVVAPSAATKTLTIGVAATDSVKATDQFVNKLTYAAASTNVVFNGSKLSGVATASPFKAQQTNIDFANAAYESMVFNVAGKDVELMATVTNMYADANAANFAKRSKITVAGKLTLTGDNAFNFANGVVEVADNGSVVVANKATATSNLGTVTFGKDAKTLSVSVKANDKNLAVLNTTAFKFTAAGQTVNANIVEDVKTAPNALKGHAVTFTKDGTQNFVVQKGSYMRVVPSWALDSAATAANILTVEGGATLVGYYSDFADNLGYTAVTDLGFTAAPTTANTLAAQTAFVTDTKIAKFTHALVMKDGATFKFDSKENGHDNYAPAVFGNVTFEGKATLADNAESAIIYAGKFVADKADLQLDGSLMLGSKDGVLKVKSIAGVDGKDQDTNRLTMMGTKLVADSVATSFVSSYDVTVGSFAADNDGQALWFWGKGTDTADGQVVAANITKGTSAYDTATIGGVNGAVKFTGDITGNSVKNLWIVANGADKSTVMETALIEVDNLYFTSANSGKIKFTKDVTINSDVKKDGTNRDGNLTFKGVTLSKNFVDDSATVAADSMKVSADVVTMKDLDVKAMSFTKASTVTTTSAVTGLTSLDIGNSAVTFIKEVEVDGNLSLTLDPNAGAKLTSNEAISVKGLNITKAADYRSFVNGKEIDLAEGYSTVVGPNITISKTYYDLVVATSGKKITGTIANRKDMGDVLKLQAAKILSADDLQVASDNLKAITKVSAKGNEFGKFEDFVISTEDNKAVAGFMPESIEAARKIVNIVDALSASRMDQFSAPMGAASGSPADAEGMALWAEGVYGAGEQKETVDGKDVTSYKDSKYGVAFGADYKISDNSVFGLAVGYGYGDVTHESSKNVEKVSAIIASAYAVQNYGDAFFNERIGFAKLDGERTFKRGTDTKSTSSPVQYFAGFAAGYNVKAAEVANVTPMFKLRAENVLAYDEAESGSSAANWTINNPEKRSLVASLGGKVSFNLGAGEEMSFSPDVHGFVNYDLLATNETDTFKISASGVSAEMKKASADAFSYEVGAGLTVKSVSGLEVGVKVDGQFREKYMGLLGALKVRIQF